MIKVTFFKDFTIEYNGKTVRDSMVKSKKYWSLLEFIIISKNREVSKTALMDLLWDNDRSENPANALKTAIHRLRAILDTLEHSEELILNTGGSYHWNTNVPIELDVEMFEKYVKQASNKELSNKERLEAYYKASDLYTADFLEKNHYDTWVVPIRVYYRSMFLQCTFDIIHLLEKIEGYAEAEIISEKASKFDPLDESLHYCLIKSRIRQGKRTAALEHYNYVHEAVYKKYELTPSKEFTALYKMIKEQTHVESMNIEEIMQGMMENFKDEAFFCNFETFKEMYEIETRLVEAKKQRNDPNPSTLALLTVTPNENSNVTGLLSRSTEALKKYIVNALKKYNIATRYSVSQYLVIMPDATCEASEKILQKAITKFKKENPKFDVDISIKCKLIEPSSKRENP